MCKTYPLFFLIFATGISAVRANVLHVPAGFPTIQAAINAAQSGDTVLVADGTWAGIGNTNLDFFGRGINLKSESGPDQCIIDCQGTARGIRFHSAETNQAILDGFTIRGGKAPTVGGFAHGGAILCEGSAAPTIVGCIFMSNVAGGGGAIAGGNGPILACHFSLNTASVGGALYNCDGPITDCTITQNSTSSVAAGLYRCDGSITNCEISNNTAGTAGGTGFVGGGGLAECQGSISFCTISNNSILVSASRGGGLYQCNGDIQYCSITGNVAYLAGGGLGDCQGSIRHCDILDNSARSAGGGAWNCNSEIANCLISGNRATSGAGLYGCGGLITNCNIMDNESISGGGGLSYCLATIRDCVISGNRAGAGGGGVRRCQGTIRHCTIVGNSAPTGGGIFDCQGSISHCIIWDNRSSQVTISATVTYSCIQGVTSCPGCITGPPLFVDPGHWDKKLGQQWIDGDYHLTTDSPGADAGDSGFIPSPGETDMDDEDRVMDGRVDIGADETTGG